MRHGILLGPIGEAPVLESLVAELELEGPVALVTAGWEEAERNDADIDHRLGGGTRNLGLYGRRLDILATDTEYAAAERRLRDVLAELREVYLLQLRHAVHGVEAVRRHAAGGRRLGGTVLDEALDAVRTLDNRYAARLFEAFGNFYTEYPPHEREAIATHRAEVEELLSDCPAVAIAGGHVGVIIDCLHLCNLGPAIGDRPLIAWSSGAMALADRVMVVDDDPAGPPDEVMIAGIGVIHRVVPLADAAHRIDLDDADRLAALARRLAPRVCVLLDEGDRLTCDAAGVANLAQARVVALDGTLRTAADAA